jgi:hypothetical protein
VPKNLLDKLKILQKETDELAKIVAASILTMKNKKI